MQSIVLRFGLTEDTGGIDALATALRRESGATILCLNKEHIVEVATGRQTVGAITLLVKGENEAFDTAIMWLDRLVGMANIDVVESSFAAATLFQNGVEARQCGDDEAALEWFERVLAIDDSLSRAWSTRANTLRDIGRVQEARASYERSIALDRADAVTRFNFGILLANAGDLGAAQVQLREALHLAPDMEPARRELETVDELIRSSDSSANDSRNQ